MKSKTKKLTAVLLILVVACSMLMVGCGKSAPKEEKTLETVLQENADLQAELDKTFADSGLDGDVAIKGNTIEMNVKIDDLLGDGIELDDATRDLFKSSFDSSFDQVEDQMVDAIKDIESSADIAGVSIDVIITYGGEVVYTRTFTS